MESDDVAQEAYFVALDIEARTNRQLDLATAPDQGVLLSWLYNKFVRYADKTIRHAVKLDKGWDDDDERSQPSIAWLLAGEESDNPEVGREVAEGERRMVENVDRSYSEASAYAILLVRWNWDLGGVANDLLLGSSVTLRRRIAHATDLTIRQDSLFDGVDRVDWGFTPKRSRRGTRALRALRAWHRRWKEGGSEAPPYLGSKSNRYYIAADSKRV